MLRLRHILHPLRTLRSAYVRGQQQWYRTLLEREFKNVRRSKRERCWCGGELQAFSGHESYGVCTECGTYVNQRPPLRAEMTRIYSRQKYWGAVSKYRGWPALENRAAMYQGDGRLAHWLGLVKRYGPGSGRAIEVGCAPGVLLANLRDRGYTCVGVELDPEVAEWMHSALGLDVRSGFFPGVELPPCELFLAFDIFEHAPEPEEFLRETARLLVNGGTAIIQTPTEREQNLFELRPDFFDDVEHTFLFTAKAMERLAQRAGLAITALPEGWMPGHEVTVLKKTANP